jgi:hypothetical protein
MIRDHPLKRYSDYYFFDFFRFATFLDFCLNLPIFISSCGFGFMRTSAPIRCLASSNLSVLFPMSRPQGKCVFCGGTPLSKEHIWSDWLDKIIPRGSDRFERVVHITDKIGPILEVEIKKRQGAVHTKKAYKVCVQCNTTWMSRIVEAAKPSVKLLVTGQRAHLAPDEQQKVASWIALTAMMADSVAKTQHKLPAIDIAHMFNDRCPPARWYIGVGYYEKGDAVAFNHAPLFVNFRDSRTGNVSSAFTLHLITMIVGHLYVLVHCISPANHPLANNRPIRELAPHLHPIWPTTPLLPFPPPSPLIITGALTPDGGQAMEIAHRLRDVVQATIVRTSSD